MNRDYTAEVAQMKDSSFSVDSNQQGSDVPEYSLKRNVKGATRAIGDDDISSKAKSDHIITISDDTDPEEPVCRSISIQKQDTGQDTSEKPIQRPDQVKSEPGNPSFEEYDSQCFEFETEGDIYSVWSDSQLEETKPNIQENKSSRPETNNIEDFDQNNDLNQWGYDTDYVSDDIIKNAAKDADQQFKLSTTTANTPSRKDHGVN
ncbi:probable helicase senataxin [Rana temporaria]|uniref:probable helicase senataxin n=1 Tax=Rana temporaria TaxID=8407 RepID=UPI001AAD05AE|nr:probable helicase senataxin [Rana temporaria]